MPMAFLLRRCSAAEIQNHATIAMPVTRSDRNSRTSLIKGKGIILDRIGSCIVRCGPELNVVPGRFVLKVRAAASGMLLNSWPPAADGNRGAMCCAPVFLRKVVRDGCAPLKVNDQQRKEDAV